MRPRTPSPAVRLLLSKGASPTLPGADGRTPLHSAASARIAAMLMERGASPSAADAVRSRNGNGSPRGFASPDPPRRLSAAARPFSRQAGRTPLHGTDRGVLPPPDVAQLLLDAGADPAAADRAGNAPLHYATGARLATARRLLARGAPPSPRNKARPCSFAGSPAGSTAAPPCPFSAALP